MKAILIEAKASPLTYVELNLPALSGNEVLVKLSAAALNHRDLFIQQGRYAGIEYPVVPGSDGCGEVVEAASDSVLKKWSGKKIILNPSLFWGELESHQSSEYQILGMPSKGTFATHIKLDASLLYESPAHLSDEAAAALPLAGLTAYRALFSRCKLKADEHVLITGIGGGVALFALQFALAAKAKVWVTSGSESKIERALSMGAEGGANYKTESWDRALKKEVGGFDVIVDGAGGAGFTALMKLANFGARIGVYGGTTGNVPAFSPQLLFWKQLNILGSTMGSNTDFQAMLNFVNAHKIQPVIDKVYPLEACTEAVSRMESASQFGKIILKMNS